MNHHPSRRSFLKNSGTLTATTLLGGSGLAACGGGESLSTEQQLALTATQAVAAIKAGTLTATAYTSTLIARAKAAGELNAMITLDEAGALQAAAKVDGDRAAGKAPGALAGLPIVVKDNINTSGLKTTGGTPALRDFQPERNAPSLQKLIDAGAIVLGKSNLHELAFGITSTNFTLGIDPLTKAAIRPCRNPYDRTRTPGGSSGGTAVAVAARFAPAGLGTDTGGSARVPAAFCGIAGFRPSVGDGPGQGRRYVDDRAVVPISSTRDTVGPMARTVADVALLDAVIAGTPVPVARALKGLRIGVPPSFWAGLDDAVAAAAEAARKKLTDAGVVWVDADLVGVLDLNNLISFQIALHEPIADIPAYLDANHAPVRTVEDLSKDIASPDVQVAFGAILVDAFGPQYPDAIHVHRPALQQRYADYFRDNQVDAVLFPTTIIAAPLIDAIHGSSTVQINGGPAVDEFGTVIRNTDPSSNAGIPSLSIPAGMTASGLPVGLQIDGPVGTDSQLLAIGLGIESVLGSLPAPDW